MNEIGNSFLQILYRYRSSKKMEYYKYLNKNQWNSLEKNINIQRELLYNIIKYAFNEIPYYKKHKKNLNTFKKETIFEDIKKLPFLTKGELKEEFDNLFKINPRLKRIYTNYSGGSTGEPTKFLQDNYYSDWSAATKMLFNEWAGRKPGDLLIKLWGSERDILGQKESLKQLIGSWIENVKILNSFIMTEENMKRYIKEINIYKPKMILAYVQPIYELAKYSQENHIKVFSPGSIMTSAGILYSEYKRLIEKVFQCPVFNRYGTREVGDIACDCQTQKGFHINLFTHYIEIIDKQGNNIGPNKMGEVVITALRNYTMPLIRFKIGDMAILKQEQCSCGRGLPLIMNVLGRDTDVFKTLSGKIVPGEYFIHFIGVVSNKGIIKRFQVIQENIDYIIVKIVLDNNGEFEKNKNVFDDIKDKITLAMGKETKIDFKLVDEILPEKSGKYRYTISKVYQ